MSVLSIDHPDTDFTLAVAHAADAVLSMAKRMTLVGSSSKLKLLDQALLARQDGEHLAATMVG